MLRYLTIILTVALLSGCSELQVIGNGALRELRADGISVEAISYNYHQKLALKEKLTGVVMAKAEQTGVARGNKAAAAGKRINTAKADRVKGLWEKH